MDSFEVKLSDMLGFIDTYGSSGFDDSRVEELEALILDCNSRQKTEYTNKVADSIWDTLYDMLKEVKPSSGILSEIWEDEGDIAEYTELLVSHPMMSIETVKSYNCREYTSWIKRIPDEPTDYFASFKINGHGIRIVYIDGDLVSATSRARASAGRDLTEHMRIMLGEHNAQLEEMGMVELRGEVCLKLENLDKAREYNEGIKSAFSAVSSLLRPSSTPEEIKLLDFLAYGFISEGFSFSTREEEFQYLEEVGYTVPDYLYIENISKDEMEDTLKEIVSSFEEMYEEFGFFCDGIVFEVNNRELFAEMGIEGNHNLGNIALKVGLWKQDALVGYVQKILWKKGKNKLSPVALIAEEPNKLIEDADGNVLNMDDLGVLSPQGNTVRRVPLYEPKNIIVFDAYPGNILNFRYGGEAGVVPCFSSGRTLHEDVVRDILSGEDALGIQ